MSAGLLGAICTPAEGRIAPHGSTWCADNGAFGKGYPGATAWLTWLARQPGRDRCAFAVAPDVVGDAAATLELSLPLLPAIRALGIPAALVAQNGLEDLPVPWDAFDVLFIGGDTAWKLGPAARQLASDAVARGKPVHMGRVNSLKRLRYAQAIGCTSVDGTWLTRGPDKNLPIVLRFIREVTEQTHLPMEGATS